MRRFLPTPEGIKGSRFLRWLGPRLHEPGLWYFNRRSVARGVAIGLFFGLLIPVAQIAVAASVAFFARANLWVSAISTLVTNPLTFAPIYFLAYRLGLLMLGAPEAALEVEHIDPALIDAVSASLEQVGNDASNWYSDLHALFTGYGKPLILGLGVLSVGASLAGYVATMLCWRITILMRQRRRAERARAAS